MDKLKAFWRHDTTQKAYRAAVVTAVTYVLVLLAWAAGSLDQIAASGDIKSVSIDTTVAVGAVVSAVAGVVRAVLAVVIPALAGYRDRRSDGA